MSASAIRRKSYKKAQEESGPFSPVHWEGDGGGGSGGEVPSGKLQVMEKFFTPVQQAKEGKGTPDGPRRDCRCRPQWTESQSGRFSTSSSSSSTSATSSSASWSSEASLDKETFLLKSPRYQPQHSQSCLDVSGEARAFPRRGREPDHAAYGADEPVPSFVTLRKGHSKSAERLPHRQAHREFQLMPAPAVDRQLYKATSLERSLVFNEEAEILAPRDPHQAGPPAPSKGILKNGGVPGADRLRKAKSIETITVRPTGREAPALGPTRPLQRERQPPNSLDLSIPKKPPVTDRMKIVEEKLRFSEFLNEITQQVMSPSSLSSLGWKPPEPSSAAKTPSTDGADSKGSSSKASSPGSSLEMPEGKAKEEMGSRPRRRPGPPDAKADAPHDRHGRRHAKTTDEASTSPESGPLAHHLGSLPILSGEAVKGLRKHGGAKTGHGTEPEALELPFKKAEKDVAPAAGTLKPAGKEQLGKTGIFIKELPGNENSDQPLSPKEQVELPVQKEEKQLKDRSTQPDLQKTWEELENLKENFTRLQEEYLDTRITNKLLEEKLQIIAQSMAEERQSLNHRINELLERLLSAQNTISTLEKINISGLLSKPVAKRPCVEKAESPDSFCSLHNLDVAPPPAFMDGASDARTTPSQSDSATETGKLGASSESDTAGPNGERTSRPAYDALGAPLAEAAKKHGKGHARATAFTPWKEKSTKFSSEPVNSTESECSGEETAAFCLLPAPRFLYLRQETLVTPTGPSGFPSMSAPEPMVFGEDRLPSPSGPSSRGQLELVPELSSSESSDDGTEVSWSPGLVEKTSGSHLDYESAQKMLDSLLHKSSAQEKTREKEAHKAGRPGGSYRLAGHKEGGGTGRALGHRRIRYYQEFPGSEESSSSCQAKQYPCPPPQVTRSLPRGAKGATVDLGDEETVQDSTSL